MDTIKFLIVALTWGCSFILMKKANPCFGPLAIAGWRCLAGVVGLLLVVWLRRIKHERGSWKLGGLAVLIFFCYLWPYSLQPFIIGKLESGFTSIMVAFVPLFTILVSIPMLKQLPDRWQLSGVLGGLAFMILLFYDKMKVGPQVGHMVLALTVPLSYAIGNTWNKRTFSGDHPLWLAIYSMSIAGVILVPASLSVEEVQINDSLNLAVISLLFLGVLGTGITIGLFYTLIQKRGPLFAGLVTYIIPLGGITFGAMDGEQLSLIQIGSLAGVLVCVGVAQWGSIRRREAETTVAGDVEL